MGGCPKVERLYLDSNKLKDTVARTLADALARSPRLASVNLGDNNFAHDCPVPSAGLAKLQGVDISNNQLTDRYSVTLLQSNCSADSARTSRAQDCTHSADVLYRFLRAAHEY
jgi:Ran GTPase-activating protein (RanGAP) involved in mRNA processing and transport